MSAPVVRLRPSSPRLTLEGGQLRLFALVERLLRATGLAVEQPAGPEGLRTIALSWLAEHDSFLRAVSPAGAGSWPDRGLASAGRGILLSDDAALLAAHPPLALPVPATRLLWAVDASTLLSPPDEPAAALTLTETEAEALVATGVDAVSLLGWPGTEPPARPGRVVLSIGLDAVHLLGDVLTAVRAGLPRTPPPDVLPDVPIRAGSVTHAPVHTAVRTRLLSRADLVIAVGEAVSADLDAFEAAGHGAAVLRVLPAEPDGPAAAGSSLGVPDAAALPALASALPAGYRLARADRPSGDLLAGDRPPGLIALPELVGWLRRVLGSTSARLPTPS